MRSRDRQQDTINPKSLAAQGHKGPFQLSWALDDLYGPFQPKPFYDSMIPQSPAYWSCNFDSPFKEGHMLSEVEAY